MDYDFLGRVVNRPSYAYKITSLFIRVLYCIKLTFVGREFIHLKAWKSCAESMAMCEDQDEW